MIRVTISGVRLTQPHQAISGAAQSPADPNIYDSTTLETLIPHTMTVGTISWSCCMSGGMSPDESSECHH